MKKSKGFTLIELLAVIVILAIIALIAAPVVLGVIDDVRKSAAKDSAYGLISAAKLHYAETLMDDILGIPDEGRVFDCDGTLCKTSGDDPITLSIDGTIPEGTFRLTSTGKVDSDQLKFNNKYCFKITGNKVEEMSSCIKK